MLVPIIHKTVPWHLLELISLHQLLGLLWYLQTVFLNIILQVILSQNFHYLNQLIVIIGPLEKSVNFENHAGHRASE